MQETKVIKIFETFAGIGAQHKAIKNIDKNFKIICTSEWDVRAMISYALIHHKKSFNKKTKEIQKWSEDKIDDFLSKRTYSLNSKKPSDIRRKHLDFKIAVVAANIVNNNFPDINKVKGKDIKNVDLLTYSFPCQGLSIANMGRAKGIKKSSDSTSNLIWQIKRILDDAKSNNIKLPKYLLMENVAALIGKKHKKDYEQWNKYLKSMGYKTFTFIFNGLDHGSIQQRKRVIGLSIKKEFVKQKLKDEELKELIKTKYGKKLSLSERKTVYNKILSFSKNKVDEIDDSIPNNTTSRKRMAKDNIDLIKEANKKNYIFNTLTTKQDRHPNIGMIKVEKKYGKLHKRFITPREAYMIMGFTSTDFSNVKPYYRKTILTKESLYRQAGNSIIVSVLESVFKYIHDFERGIYD